MQESRRADLLWNCLCQLGIYPHLSVLDLKKERRFSEREGVVDINHYCCSVNADEEWQRDIFAVFVGNAIVRDDEGFMFQSR